MMQAQKKPDEDSLRGTSAALQQTFNGSGDGDGMPLGSIAADADFAALLTQLNDPPKAYRPSAADEPH